MSMPIIERPDNPIDRGQSINDLIESVALVETGLSHIINAEGEKIQKVLKYDDPTADVPIEDIIAINDSVEKMINKVAKLEMYLQNKLDIIRQLDTEPLPITENAYMFACNKESASGPFSRLPEDQIFYNFTPNNNNTEFTTSVTGKYLISYRISLDEPLSTNAMVEINYVPVPASILSSSVVSNTSSSTFLCDLNAGDFIALWPGSGARPIDPQGGVCVYMCAVKIAD